MRHLSGMSRGCVGQGPESRWVPDDAGPQGHVAGRRLGRAAVSRSLRRSSQRCHTTRSGLALKIEEYVPEMIPRSSASTNVPIAAPAKSSSDSSVITTVRLVVIDRPNVWRIEWLTIRSNGSPAWRARFSRIRSNTTIVSCTEKPMTVSIAVTNRLSIWSPRNVPRIANAPTTTRTSWRSEISAQTPILKSRKRYVIQSRMPIDPNRIRVRACTMRSLETTAPTVDSDCCSVIGPRAASSANRTSPSLPCVGRTPPDTGAADGEAPGAPLAPSATGDAEADGFGEAAGLALATGEGLAAGEALGPTDALGAGDPLAPAEAVATGDAPAPADALAAGDALTAGEPETAGEPDAPGGPDAPAEADGIGVGRGAGAARAASFVRISM